MKNQYVYRYYLKRKRNFFHLWLHNTNTNFSHYLPFTKYFNIVRSAVPYTNPKDKDDVNA